MYETSSFADYFCCTTLGMGNIPSTQIIYASYILDAGIKESVAHDFLLYNIGNCKGFV